MLPASFRFVRDKFSEYYQNYSSTIEPPVYIEKREFGFLSLKGRNMVRHKSFMNVDSLRAFLKMIVPSDVYYSAAYYENPQKEMRGKGWLGADLIFDIDSDHIPAPCAKTHDTWFCGNCENLGRGKLPERCPKCGESRLDERTLPCEICLGAAKEETIKLIDILVKDFGFSSKEFRIGFSGHRGYHLHIESEEIRGFDSMARKEIVDYLLGIGLEASFHGLEESGRKKSRLLRGPDLYGFGWRGRIARGTYDLLLTMSPVELEKAGLKKRAINAVMQHKQTLLDSWKGKGPWGIIKSIDTESWKKIARYGVKKQSVKIDSVVTTDIHRLIRLTDTLHGKTGLKKTEVPIIESFDPLKSAVAFKKGTVTLLVSDVPQFRLRDEIFGPYHKRKVELPTAAALLLLCKGAADMVQ